MNDFIEIKNSYANLSNTLKEIVEKKKFNDDELSQLSYQEIIQLINYNKKINNCGYTENERIANNFIKQYLESKSISNEKKIEIILFNNNEVDDSFIDLNNYKNYILSILDKKNYYKIIEYIKDEKLYLNYNDLEKINFDFIDTLITDATMFKYKFIDDEGNIKMSKYESLFVNLLMLFYNKIKDNKQVLHNLFKCYMKSCNPKLHHIPITCNIFEGELLNKIYDYYENKSSNISPIIKYRRNLEIIEDNNKLNHYNYNDYISEMNKRTFGMYARSITIEFPYMCYGYISDVEIDYTNDKPTKIFFTNDGNEYILKSTFNINSYENNSDIVSKIKTMKISKSCSDPATFISISFGFIDMIYIKGIRIYGKAISLI